MAEPAPSVQHEAFEGMQALQEACARNTPVEVIRRGRNELEPPARGRLIELHDDRIVLEKVHVIGREIHYPPGTSVECYFSYAGALLSFRTKVIDAGQPIKLNDQVVLPGMSVVLPERVESGQRRQVYRVSLGSIPVPVKAELWFDRDVRSAHDKALSDHAALNEQAPPVPAPTLLSVLSTLQPAFSGSVADGSDMGAGIMLPGAIYTRFKVFERLWARLTLPGEPSPLLFIAEVRHTRDVPRLGARVGVTFLSEDALGARIGFPVRRFVTFLTQVQRERRR